MVGDEIGVTAPMVFERSVEAVHSPEHGKFSCPWYPCSDVTHAVLAVDELEGTACFCVLTD